MMTELESVDEAENTITNGVHEKKAEVDGTKPEEEEFSGLRKLSFTFSLIVTTVVTKRLLTASYCGYYIALGLVGKFPCLIFVSCWKGQKLFLCTFHLS